MLIPPRRLRSVFAHLGLAWAAILVGCSSPSSGNGSGVRGTASVRPPIFLISFDTARADVFGALTGEQPSLTPNLDKLAADSVLFEHAFVQAPHTLPSHMSLFTSVYPDVHGVKPEQKPLGDAIETLPEMLHEAGYWTLGLATSEWLKAEFGFGRGFDQYEVLPHRPTYADRVNEAALARLRTRWFDHRPAFVFLHYYDLHSDFDQGTGNKLPYYSPPGDRAQIPQSEDGAEFCDPGGHCNTQYLIAADLERRVLPQSEIDTIHELYRDAVPALDAAMGRFLDELRSRGIYEDSLIVVTADHGEEFREHGRFIHSQPYDETIAVPLFIKFPRSWQAGLRVGAMAETVDILPTILDVLGLTPPRYIQGESLMPLVDPRSESTRRKTAVASQDTINQARYGLRTAHWKIIMDLKAGRREIYDLDQDPGETHDLSTEEPDVADRLQMRLEQRVRTNRALSARLSQDATSVDTEGVQDTLSAEERERLKALGYLN